VARSYSLASLPFENELELHVRKIPGGAMSEWLHHKAQPGARLWLRGPAGNCFYLPGNTEQPMLLAGAGTGLASLYGILRDALRQGHTGPVWLFQGAVTDGGLYLTRELTELERACPNFHYARAVLHGSNCVGGAGATEVGSLDDCILRRFTSLAGWKGYICGDPPLVNSLHKKLFLAGWHRKRSIPMRFCPPLPGESENPFREPCKLILHIDHSLRMLPYPAENRIPMRAARKVSGINNAFPGRAFDSHRSASSQLLMRLRAEGRQLYRHGSPPNNARWAGRREAGTGFVGRRSGVLSSTLPFCPDTNVSVDSRTKKLTAW
jgi:NAD(P)H-flavin reductase